MHESLRVRVYTKSAGGRRQYCIECEDIYILNNACEHPCDATYESAERNNKSLFRNNPNHLTMARFKLLYLFCV
jgi:hypothetical protein